MHLAREADPAVIVAGDPGQRGLGRSNPVAGVLFGPTRLRGRQRVLLVRTTDDVALRRERERLDA